MKVSVTDGHIKRGKHTCRMCPIALALSDEYQTDDVFVGQFAALLDKRRFKLPEVARDFITKYDAGETVAPITFTLETLP